MGKCSHDHKNADKWTNIATVGEGLSSALSNFYWGVSLANLAYETPGDDTSDVPLYIGSALTLLALGAMYAHRKLNTYHQPNHDVPEHIHHESISDDHLITPIDQLATPLSAVAHSAEDKENKHAQLTKLQKVALAADFITHTGDVSGAITAGVDLITKLAVKNTVPVWGRALVQCVSTLFGATSAVANVRSCKNAMVAQSGPQLDSEQGIARLV